MIHRNKAAKLGVGKTSLFEMMAPDMNSIIEFHEKVECVVKATLRIKLEERGYEFPDERSLLSFIENKMSGTIQFLRGSPFNKTVTFSIKGEDNPILVLDFTPDEKTLGIGVVIKMRNTRKQKE